MAAHGEAIEYLEVILDQYDIGTDWEVKQQEGGMNNTTRFVYSNSHIYILRIYENHQCEDKVKFEHVVLQALQSSSMLVQVPKPVPTRQGQTFVRLPNGKLAAMFHYIKGNRASKDSGELVKALGMATGELVTALAKVQVEVESSYLPYYEIYEVHPLVTEETLLQFLESQPFPELVDAVGAFREEMYSFEANIAPLLSLPVQLIHSDLVFDNALAQGEEITAILDFEFVTPDLRAMEIAVCLSEVFIPGNEQLWEQTEAFIIGYGSTAKLTEAEIEAIPMLINTRRIVVVIHFLGRVFSGIDSLQSLEKHLLCSVQTTELLGQHKEQLLSLCRKYLLQV